MNTKVNLCGIMHRVTAAEMFVVFSEESAIGGRPTRFAFERSDQYALWSVVRSEGWGEGLAACHIVSAYYWVLANVGGNHNEPPLNANGFVEHKLEYDEERRMTFCGQCGKDLSPQMQWVSCG